MYSRSYNDSRYLENYKRKSKSKTSINNSQKIIDLFIKQIIVALIIFFCIYILRLVKTDYAKNAISHVKKNINYNININHEKKEITDYFNKLLSNIKTSKVSQKK